MQRDFPTLFDLARPDRWTGGVIFASPHSGRDYPDWFLAESRLTPFELRSSEDAFVDRLIAPAVAAGAVTLTARVPRCVVDLNRGADELDPAAIEGTPSRRADPRIQSGLGVIPRVVAQGRAIRRGKLSAAEAQRRGEDGAAQVEMSERAAGQVQRHLDAAAAQLHHLAGAKRGGDGERGAAGGPRDHGAPPARAPPPAPPASAPSSRGARRS